VDTVYVFLYWSMALVTTTNESPSELHKQKLTVRDNTWERRSQIYFDSGNGVPMNAIDRSFVTLFVNTPRLRPNSQFAKSNLFVLYCLQFGASSSNSMADSRGGAGVRPP